MVERPERERIDDGERAPSGREWEVFVRDAGEGPMQHVGSVRARNADGAYDLASRLFAWYASEVWVCPSDAVSRYTDHDLAAETTPLDRPTDDEQRNRELS